jgi:hypothetical protein
VTALYRSLLAVVVREVGVALVQLADLIEPPRDVTPAEKRCPDRVPAAWTELYR